MLVFLQDLFLKVPVEIGCTMEELDDVLFLSQPIPFFS